MGSGRLGTWVMSRRKVLAVGWGATEALEAPWQRLPDPELCENQDQVGGWSDSGGKPGDGILMSFHFSPQRHKSKLVYQKSEEKWVVSSMYLLKRKSQYSPFLCSFKWEVSLFHWVSFWIQTKTSQWKDLIIWWLIRKRIPFEIHFFQERWKASPWPRKAVVE